MSTPSAPAKVMNVTIITKESDDRHIHHEQPRGRRVPGALR
jgi:hypothetical protein